MAAHDSRVPVWDEAGSRARIGIVAAVVAAALVIAVASAALVGPNSPTLSDTTSGDAALIERVEELLAERTSGHDAVAVAVIDGDRVRFAGFGDEDDGDAVSESTAFEIGSVTKPMTGMLLADMIDDGEVDPDSTLREAAAAQHEIDGDGAEATLEALASHRAGYPRLPLSSLPAAFLSSLTGGDPYTGSARTVLDTAAGVDADPGDFSYSNLGFAALGDGLAAHQQTTYDELLRTRLLEPIGMDDTVIADSIATLPSDRVSGHSAGGRDADEWLATGWQAAGIGTWSTTEDLAELADAIIDGSAPGMAALEPRFERDGDQWVGYGWPITTTEDDVELTAHAGGTGGFRSWFGIDRASQRAVVVLSNTTVSVRDLGEALLFEEPGPLPARSPGLVGWALAAVLLAGTIGPLIAVVRAAIRRKDDRHGLVRPVVNSVATAVAFTVLIPWHVVPDVVWVVAVASTLITAIVVVAAWRRTPAIDSDRPRLRWIGTAATATVGAAVIFLVSI